MVGVAVGSGVEVEVEVGAIVAVEETPEPVALGLAPHTLIST